MSESKLNVNNVIEITNNTPLEKKRNGFYTQSH